MPIIERIESSLDETFYAFIGGLAGAITTNIMLSDSYGIAVLVATYVIMAMLVFVYKTFTN